MNLKLVLIAALVVAPTTVLSTLAGCDEKKPATTANAPAKFGDHGHDHGAAGGGEDAAPKSGRGGATIALGEQAIGSFTAKAVRDQSEVVKANEASIDVIVTPRAGAALSAAAVRMWIGSKDARGSVKAKAEIEDPKEPNRWHVHAEIPSPLPADSKLWVEIEDEKGGTAVGGFELPM